MPGLTLALGGDVMLGRLVDDALVTRAADDPWRALLPVDADLFLYNLECAVCGELPEWEPVRKTFHFRLDPLRADTLLESGVDAVQLANNHAMDHDVAGLIETLDVLDELGIPHAGAGRTLADARAHVSLPGGVALVAAADHPREWAAAREEPGIFLIDSESGRSRADVAEAIAVARRQGARVVVLGLHWGPNMRREPTERFCEFARAALDAGATIVWGTSAHLFQGIEFYGDGVILYDTGDLLDDYAVDPVERNDISFLFFVDLDGEGRVRRVRLRPTLIADRRVRPAPDAEARWAMARMRELCGAMGTTLSSGREAIARPSPAAARRIG